MMFSKNYRNIENINKNKELLLKYPFLTPTRKYVDFYVGKDVEYDYTFTMADLFFDGYIKAFGNDLFNEIKNELIKTNDLYNCLLVFVGSGYFLKTILKESLLFFEFFEDFHGDKYKLNCILNKYKNMMNFICTICGNNQFYLQERFLCSDCTNVFGNEIYDVDLMANFKLNSIIDFPYDYIVDFNRTQDDNKKIIKNLPFLMPTKKNIDFFLNGNPYDYSFTALDFLPKYFLIKYRMKMFEEIDLELMKNNNRDKCHFVVNEFIMFLDNCEIAYFR